MSNVMAGGENSAKILVVDDDPDVCDIVERCLKDAGLRVWTTHDGSRVFDIVAEKGIDLAIVDLMLPDTDGLMLTRKLKEHSSIGVIILSGGANPPKKSSAWRSEPTTTSPNRLNRASCWPACAACCGA